MHYCTECNSVEGKIVYIPLNESSSATIGIIMGEAVIETCGECGCDEDGCIKRYDEDYGQDR